MAIIDFISFGKEYKDSAAKARRISKLRLTKEPRLYITLGTRGRGGRGLGRFHEITEIFIDSDNRVFAGFIAVDDDKSGSCYKYVPIGLLLSLLQQQQQNVLNGEEEEEEEEGVVQ